MLPLESDREPSVAAQEPCSRLTLRQAVLSGDAARSAPATAAIKSPSLLGAICYGTESVLDAQRGALESSDRAVQYVSTPLLGGPAGDADACASACLWQLIFTDRPVRSGQSHGIGFRTDGVFVFGVLELPPLAGRAGELLSSAHVAYEEIFSFLDRLDAARPYRLWRVWNYMPDIHGEEAQLERYRQFNIGRLRAFTAHWASGVRAPRPPYDPTAEIPASCGLGLIGPSPRIRLSVAFLASHLPFVQIENPRQVSAYHYPPDYGPSSPTFSRAVMGPAERPRNRPCPYLFVSGTGSIVGHRSLHSGDVEEQCRECLRNIEALVEEANRRLTARDRGTLGMRELHYLVYLRHPRDLAAVQKVLTGTLGREANVRIVHADICRSDLLVEIEASLLSAAPPA